MIVSSNIILKKKTNMTRKVNLYKDTFSLIFGDCLDVMKSIESNSVDMVCADLPYGTTSCKWDSVIPLDELWNEYKRVCKRDAAIVLTACQPFTSKLVMSNLKWFKHDWVWKKNKSTGFLNAKHAPLKNHESVLVFCRGRLTYNPQKTHGHKAVNKYTKHKPDGDTIGNTRKGFSGGGSTSRYPVTIQEFKVINQNGLGSEKKYHPTQKPVALIEYLINTYTNIGETVLDNSMGSGTTGVACIKTGRNFIGIEKDSGFFDVARERIHSEIN